MSQPSILKNISSPLNTRQLHSLGSMSLGRKVQSITTPKSPVLVVIFPSQLILARNNVEQKHISPGTGLGDSMDTNCSHSIKLSVSSKYT